MKMRLSSHYLIDKHVFLYKQKFLILMYSLCCYLHFTHKIYLKNENLNYFMQNYKEMHYF